MRTLGSVRHPRGNIPMFQFQKISNYGTATPAVARTLFQGSELLKFFIVPDEQKERCKAVLFELKRHLIRCVEIRDRISAEIEEARTSVEKNGLQFQSRGQAVSLPGVADLEILTPTLRHSCSQLSWLFVRLRTSSSRSTQSTTIIDFISSRLGRKHNSGQTTNSLKPSVNGSLG